MKSKNRIDYIDCAKGIGIILVIIGHTVKNYNILCSAIRGIIFSFHMPLFFILSGFTYRLSDNYEELKTKIRKASKHLLVPVLIIFIINITYCALKLNISNYKLFALQEFYSLLFSSGINTSFGGIDVPGIGMPWFFVALFLGRSLFDYLHLLINDDRIFMVICSILSIIGFILGSTQWLPFSLDIVFTIMPLFYFGDYMKKEKYCKNTISSFVIWIILFLFSSPLWGERLYLEFAVRRYPIYPICLITSIFGSLFVINFSRILTLRGKKFIRPIIFFGKYSIYIFVIHCCDNLPMLSYLWQVSDNELVASVIRVVVDVVIFIIGFYVTSFVKHVKADVNLMK